MHAHLKLNFKKMSGTYHIARFKAVCTAVFTVTLCEILLEACGTYCDISATHTDVLQCAFTLFAKYCMELAGQAVIIVPCLQEEAALHVKYSM